MTYTTEQLRVLTAFLRWEGRRLRHGKDEHSECYYCDLRRSVQEFRAIRKLEGLDDA